MQTSTGMYESDHVRVRRVECRAGQGPAGGVEEPLRDALVLPSRGVFGVHHARHTESFADPTAALFFARGRPHRISHPAPGGDECIVLEFDDATLHTALARGAGADTLLAPKLRFSVPLSPALVTVRMLLRTALLHGGVDGMAVEEAACGLLAGAIAGATAEPSRRVHRTRTTARHHAQCDAVRATILRDPAARHTLASLGRGVHCTPYELARVFRRCTGTTVHGFITTTRLLLGVERLVGGDDDVSRIALAAGFSSHSHFTATLRRATGLTPAALRRSARVNPVSEVRRILTAGTSH
jgi:AraC family transcriptional regulator